MIRSEIDIHPDAWFLTCHFVSDPVMPGTLMYESCLQTLRVFLMRMGWIAARTDSGFEPLPGIETRLRCRGQVVPSTKKASYEITVKELGYGPEPYVLADAMMFADGKPIVQVSNMSLRLRGGAREEIEALWRRRAPKPPKVGAARENKLRRKTLPEVKPAVYDRAKILEFAEGKPSVAFGSRYEVFDRQRFIARLPRPPYFFMDRITEVKGPPWELRAGIEAEAQYDVPEDAWYFRANRQPSLPFSVLLEFPLQTCGWLAAYIGSALSSDVDLHFRNLSGKATLYEDVGRQAGTLTARTRVLKVSQTAGMIVQEFSFSVSRRGKIVYEGETSFGFFPKDALAQQAGIRGAKPYVPSRDEIARVAGFDHASLWNRPGKGDVPIDPDDLRSAPLAGLNMPAPAFRMIDSVELYIPDGGPHGLGFIRGVKKVDPEEWFFRAHFYQDPVWPGSLGLEAFLQLLKVVAVQRWGARFARSHRFDSMKLGAQHSWDYRGHVIQANRGVVVQAVIDEIDDEEKWIKASGFLTVDGLVIYEMKDFVIRAVPIEIQAGDGR